MERNDRTGKGEGEEREERWKEVGMEGINKREQDEVKAGIQAGILFWTF